MEYTIFKTCSGNVLLEKGEFKILLTDTENSVTLDDDTYWDLMEDKQHLISNGLIYVQQTPIIVETVEKKKVK